LSTRAQESENIWDLSESGLGRGINFLDDEKEIREKERSKLVIAHLYFITNIFFSTHLYPNGSSGLHNFQDLRYNNIFRFILGYGKII